MAAEVGVHQPLAAVLVERGITIESFGRALGLTEIAARRLAGGEVLPTPEQARRISQYIGQPEHLLFYPPRRETRFHSKACRSCGTEFEPNNPNNAYCPTCRARRAS